MSRSAYTPHGGRGATAHRGGPELAGVARPPLAGPDDFGAIGVEGRKHVGAGGVGHAANPGPVSAGHGSGIEVPHRIHHEDLVVAMPFTAGRVEEMSTVGMPERAPVDV